MSGTTRRSKRVGQTAAPYDTRTLHSKSSTWTVSNESSVTVDQVFQPSPGLYSSICSRTHAVTATSFAADYYPSLSTFFSYYIPSISPSVGCAQYHVGRVTGNLLQPPSRPWLLVRKMGQSARISPSRVADTFAQVLFGTIHESGPCSPSSN